MLVRRGGLAWTHHRCVVPIAGTEPNQGHKEPTPEAVRSHTLLQRSTSSHSPTPSLLHIPPVIPTPSPGAGEGPVHHPHSPHTLVVLVISLSRIRRDVTELRGEGNRKSTGRAPGPPTYHDRLAPAGVRPTPQESPPVWEGNRQYGHRPECGDLPDPSPHNCP